MSLVERFMGIPDPAKPFTELVANPALESPLSLRVLFPAGLDFDGNAIEHSLRSLDTVLERARAETVSLADEKQADNAGSLIGLAGWGPHVVKIVYFDAPIPENVFEACVRPAHFSPQLKEDAKQHKAHAILFYAGDAIDPMEQYATLATVAAALARMDALVVLNEVARAAFPAEALLATDEGTSLVESLRQLPIPLLYGGFVKVEVEGQPGVWMRTFGNHLLNLQNLALWADGHELGNDCFEVFTNVLMYAREANVEFAAGQTVQLGEERVYRFRDRTPAEWWLESEGTMLVLERVAKPSPPTSPP